MRGKQFLVLLLVSASRWTCKAVIDDILTDIGNNMKLAKTHESSFNGHGKAINAISWNCDGKKLATGSSDQTARVWTIESHKEGRELVLEDHKEGVEGLSWSPTNSDVRDHKIVRLWDIRGELANGIRSGWLSPSVAKKSFKIDAEDDVLNVSFSPDGTMLMISDKSENVRLIDIRSNKNKTLANLSFDKEYWRKGSWYIDCSGRRGAISPDPASRVPGGDPRRCGTRCRRRPTEISSQLCRWVIDEGAVSCASLSCCNLPSQHTPPIAPPSPWIARAGDESVGGPSVH
eukprot:747686-Hanusia_phi.AAC.7